MAAIGTGALLCHGTTTSTTAETWTLTSQVNQVEVVNRDTTDTIYVTVATGLTSAAAIAAVVTAVDSLDESWAILPLTKQIVFRSTRKTYVSGSVIGNASPVSIHGSLWLS